MAQISTAYPYFEDVNEGVLRQFPALDRAAGPRRVLDLGCGSGALGEAIRNRGYEVWGVEANASALSKAECRLDRVFEGDIADVSSLKSLLGENEFDFLVFSDVLEHLPDSESTLRSYHPLLRSGGSIVVSVPNVANWQTRLGLLLGRFNYTDVGVMDRTHLHFFTGKTARQLVEGAGFRVTRTDATPLIVRALAPMAKRRFSRHVAEGADPANVIIDSPAYAVYLKLVYPLEYRLCSWLPGLLAFRLILVATDEEGLGVTI